MSKAHMWIETYKREHTATRCNTLQHTAIHCNALQRTATHCNTMQHTATHCNTLQHTATHCYALQQDATHFNRYLVSHSHCTFSFHKVEHVEFVNVEFVNVELICRWRVEFILVSQKWLPRVKQDLQKRTHCSTLQHTATHCNTLQHTATHCNEHLVSHSRFEVLFHKIWNVTHKCERRPTNVNGDLQIR